MARKPFDPDALLEAALRGEAPCGDLRMRIARDGTWYYRGSPITRPALTRLFAGILRRAEDGSHWLVTPVEQGRVEVEDAPFTIVELQRGGDEGDPTITLRTNLDDWLPLDAGHPLRLAPADAGAAVPYVTVRDRLEARVTRPVFYELVELADPQPDGTLAVRSYGLLFPLGALDG